ncbi:uncharacterized protein LOC132750568 [Ruditapes philippinarum]|uniref:uncharacterized protein LOC132750568 n=1 Tax=Ruditapes philippinarum TaxID=129788 RepID=UPI00295ADA88|nr:uncharacterized protein LOC132750568 [Ruditapes philippinarum]
MSYKERCISALEERAKPSKNDIRYARYVNSVNCFLSKFGRERVHLVGSTGELSKLAYPKDDGDADFLLVSGKLEIPVENLVQNEYAPCYVWITADSLHNHGCEIIQGKYLSTKDLRSVGPELFTILRAVYLPVTAQMDKLPEAGENLTMLTVSSKVGLQITKYREFKLDEGVEDIRQKLPNTGAERSKSVWSKGLKNVEIHDHEKKIYRRLYEIGKLAERKKDNGGITFFAQIIGEILKQDKIFYQRPHNDSSHCSNSNDEDENVLYELKKFKNNLECVDTAAFRATFTETSHKDFVPVLKIKGTLRCMEKWKTRVEKLNWPPERVDRIFNANVFVAARMSPVNPNPEKDFCLSFNLPEKEMMLSISPVQKKVFLIMKAFLKGIIEKRHAEIRKELTLKTYHIKHLMFWVYEEKVEEMESVSYLLKKALDSLTDALRSKKLSHYFVESNNMFVDFEDTDYEILLTCVDEVKSSPMKSLEFYIGLNERSAQEVLLTEDEISCILEMSADGGRNEYLQRTKEAMIDFQRGVNENRNANGCSPLIEAIVDTVKLCLQDEGSDNLQIIKLVHAVLTNGQTDIAQIDKNMADKNIEDVVMLIVGLSIMDHKLRSYVNHFGGKDGIRHILRGAFCGKGLDLDIDLREQIVDSLRRYLSCSDIEEDSLFSELKYKMFGYVTFRKEFSDTKGLRDV